MKQAQALTVMMSGRSVFLTGAPGAGKSYVLNQFVRLATNAGKRVAVTASTGIAATHINGTTIHSWSGLGVRDSLSAYDLDIFSQRAPLVKRYQTTDVLVIDEISMLSAPFLDMVSLLAKKLRGSLQPFGGMQVVLVGDMFQLPPVTRGSTLASNFAHDSAAWRELDPAICYITEQHRQGDDPLLSVLEAMRAGELEEYHQELLQNRLALHPDESTTVTRLYAHNLDVDAINNKHLAALGGVIKQYQMATKGAAAKVEQLARGILAPAILELKVGAEVMFVANDFAKGFANGSRGRVIDIAGEFPRVELVSTGRIVAVEPHSWQLTEDNRVRAEVAQLPLRLAWAITIHKSQGMSLDAAEIDLSRTFTPGMGYVALSRVRSLDGIYLRGINNMALQLHPDIFELDQALRQASAELAMQTDDFIVVQAPTVASGTTPNPELLERLKDWRRSRAETEGVPAYIVAHNNVLEAIATTMPQDIAGLMGIKGMGPAKLEKIGQDLLAITTDFASTMSAPAPEAHDADVATTENEPTSEAVPQLTDTEIVERAALRASKTAEIKLLYPYSGRRWKPEEDAKVLEHLQAMTSLEKVCDELQRSPGSVWAHVGKLLYNNGKNDEND